MAKITAALGDRLQANIAIMTLARTDQGVHIAVGLKPEQAERIEPGMRAVVTPLLNARSETFQGSVRQIGGTLNPKSHLHSAHFNSPEPIYHHPARRLLLRAALPYD